MKFALLILVLLPLVCGLIDPVSMPYTLPLDPMSVVRKIVDTVGPNASEVVCENECNAILHNNALLTSGCDLICKSLLSLVKQFNIV